STMCSSVFITGLYLLHDSASSTSCALSLHDALPISCHHRTDQSPWSPESAALRRRRSEPHPPSPHARPAAHPQHRTTARTPPERSEEHTSELQSRENLVCRLLLEKKKDLKRKTTRLT